jgi:multicomponent Na+:H+ antiporter subunit C
MSIAIAALVGLLVAVGLHLLMRDDLIDHVFGVIVLSHGANLLVFGSGGLLRGAPPVLDDTGRELADPLPQALVLTAIVIGFGVAAFATVLIARLRERGESGDGPPPKAEG